MQLIITGTDTNVGKTLIAAGFVHLLQASYWKPLQTGIAAGDDDSKTVQQLTGMANTHFLPPLARLQAPLSPAAAAEAEGIHLRTLPLLSVPTTHGALVIEGAGGVHVPVNRTTLMIDLFKAWKLPTLVVARTSLGTINHTLLTVEALRRRQIPILGVVLNGTVNTSNRLAIEHHGQVAILGEVPHLENPTAAVVAGYLRMPTSSIPPTSPV
jgi:dethiobiotin synthase